MKIINDPKLDLDDVLLVPQRNTLESRNQVKIDRTFKFYHSPREWTGIPIICANMPSVATFTMAKALAKHQIITALHKYYTGDQLYSFFSAKDAPENIYDYAWVTIGMKDADIERISEVYNRRFLNIVIDVPNGHIEKFVKFCAKVRNVFDQSIICAGNVVSPAMVQELIIHGGVDIVKIQVGPGKSCQTRFVTGVGYPTLSCIDECSGVAHGLKSAERKLGLVCSDGGIKNSGDLCKAFAAGSDFAMLGSMLAGTDECDEAEWEYEYEYQGATPYGAPPQTYWSVSDNHFGFGSATGKIRKCAMKYYGMSTHYAQEKHGEGKKEYRASEGEILTIPYKGPVEGVIQEALGGVRSCCTYIGANSIKDMSKCAVFVKTNRLK
jgi:GMP reductase